MERDHSFPLKPLSEGILETEGFTVNSIGQGERSTSPRRGSEAALRQRQDSHVLETVQQFANLFELGERGIWALDTVGRLTFLNSAMARMLGCTEDEAVGLPLFWFLDETWRADLETHLQQRRRGVAETYDLKFRRRDGTELWAIVSATPAFDSDGHYVGVAGLASDITQWRRAEALLKESETRFRRLSEGPQSCIFRCETYPTQKCSYISPTVVGIVGYTPEEFYRDPCLLDRLVHPEDRTSLRALRAAPMPSWTVTLRVLHKDGHTVWVEQRNVAVYDGSGRKTAYEGIIRDVTRIKLGARRLSDLERFQNEMLDTAAVWIHIRDADGNILFWNRAAERVTGYSRQEVLGHPGIWEWLYSNQTDRERALSWTKQTVLKRRRLDGFESTIRRKDGKNRRIIWYSSNLALEEGSAAIAIGNDITEHRQMEEQLLRAQRLETAGKIAAQVAHDFNNLLGPFVTFPEMIKQRMPGDELIAEYCDTMVQAAERMADINTDLLVLGMRGSLEHRVVDLNQLVAEALSHATNVPDTLVVDLKLADDLMYVSGAPSQLLRVLANLIVNAREAMQDQGTLTIQTESVYLDRPLSGYNRVEVGQYVRVTVADTGSGIPPDIRDKVFDPFFTTKHMHRRGSGLGLAVVKNIICDHKGYIDLESEIAKGTTFSLYLPICGKTPIQESEVDIRGGTERLLVVDDDVLQQKVLTAMLEQLGYRVRVAASGEDALDLLREQSADLLILDMVIPGRIDAVETYRRALEIYPEERAIIISGFAEPGRIAEVQSLGAGSFLCKPVNREKLAVAVRGELDRIR